MPRPGTNPPEKVDDMKGTLIRLFKSLEKWSYFLIISVILALLAASLATIAPKRLASLTDIISEGIKPNTKVIETIKKEMISNNGTPNSFHEFKVDGVIITVKDQQEFMSLMSNAKTNEDFIKNLNKAPKSIKQLIEPKINMDKLKTAALILAIIYILNSVFTYLEGIIMAYVANGYTKKLRADIITKINHLPLRYFDNHETGDILSRVTNDVDAIGINMSNNITSLVTNLTLFLGSIVMMFVTNWIMALTAIFSSIIGFIFSFLLLKKSQKYFTLRQKELGTLNGHIEEIYSGHNVVKAYNGEKDALEEFDKVNDRLYNCNLKSQFLSGIMQPIMIFIGNFGYVAVCVVGALLVMNNQTTFGVIVAFMIYIRLFTNPLSRIAQALTVMQSIAAASERVFEFMDEKELSDEEECQKKLKIQDAKGNIEFKHVKFAYDDNRTIINDFSANVKAGQKIAIVGPTGAGKTTMVNLLMKFYEIKEGDIIIDGASIHDLKRNNIHDLFVMVLQDTWLFNGTIKENIQFNQKRLSEEEIWNICKIVGIDHFVKTLPGGLNSIVENNDSISSSDKSKCDVASKISA